MRAGCLLVICGVIRQLTERKGINYARPKLDKHGGFAPRTCVAAATGPWAARNAMRLRRWTASRTGICL